MKAWLQNIQRGRARRRVGDNPLAEFLATPPPPNRTPFHEAELVCLDIETTGLDASRAEILSVGWVMILNNKIELGTAESHLVRPSGAVEQSATVHGLTDTEVAAGEALLEVLPRILAVLSGRVLVVHYAGLDKALLDRLCRQHYGAPLIVPVIDTLYLEQRRHARRDQARGQKSLRLADLRRDYGLPHYAAHDCLVDAIATAELLLAMVAQRTDNNGITLGDLMR